MIIFIFSSLIIDLICFILYINALFDTFTKHFLILFGIWNLFFGYLYYINSIYIIF